MSEPTQTADNDFYSARYSSDQQKLRDVIFAQVYDDYFGQSSWVSTADYDRFAGWLELSSESRLLDIVCGSGQPSLRIAAGTAEAGFRMLERVDLTATFAQIAERHCAARAAHEQALRSLEAEEEFELQNQYRTIGAQLARERRLSHFAYLAHKI